VIQRVEDLALAEAERTGTAVGTVGSVELSPNATNVIPGRTELGVDIRDVERDSMDAIQEGLREAVDRVVAERGLAGSTETRIDVDPTPMADRAIGAIHDGARAAGVEAMDLHSGAGHDTMHVATATDAGMLFAPSVDGISHSPREWTDWVDCATVTEVLAESMLELAGR
jgi:N-carbamoyl-L-amino-acid hydrolase